MKVFAYGTLLQGERNYRVVAPYVDRIEPGTICGTLYNYGPFPFLVLTPTGQVVGEWMIIKEGMEQEALVSLDRLEGYHEGSASNLYDRVTVHDLAQPELDGYVYVYPSESNHIQIRDFPVIVQGDWRRREESVYFAYGSCMNEDDFHRTIPNGKMLSRGLLLGYVLRFNGYSPTRNGGIANVEMNRDQWVEGVLWSVSNRDLAALDRREGHPYFYRRVTAKIRVKHGFVKAFTYQLVRGNVIDYDPSPEYLSLILDAPVSNGYKKILRQSWSREQRGRILCEFEEN